MMSVRIDAPVSQPSPPDVRTFTLASGIRLEAATRGSGPAILFLHGYTDSWRSFEAILERLPADVAGLAISQRGHGGSDRPASGYRIQDFAEDARAVLDAADIVDAVVVGHSMGSLVAQELAMRHPERVRGLVLVASATSYDTPVVAAVEDAIGQLGDSIPYSFAWDFQASTVHRPVPAELLHTAASESLRVPPRVWREALRETRNFDAADRLAALTMPTLIMWGDRDEIVSRGAQDRLLAEIPRATFLDYEGTGHAVHWEEPQRFTDDLLAFMRAVAGNVMRG